MGVRCWLVLWLLGLPGLAAAEGGRPPTATPVPGAVDALQVLVSLVVVLLLIAAMAWLLRRFGQFPLGQGGALRIIGAVSLGQRERAVLVQVGDSQILLGVAPGSVQTLHVLERPVEIGPTMPAGESFGARLAAALKRQEGK